MNNNSIEKEILYSELEEYKKTFLEYFTSIFVLKDCKYYKRKNQILTYSLKIDLEMKVPSYKEMKKFCRTDWSKINVSNNAEHKLEFHLIKDADTPYVNLLSNDKTLILEIKQAILAKIKENN